jgi:hypothetical protein
MKHPLFKLAYKQFMIVVVRKITTLTADQLKASEKTARMLIKANFHKILKALVTKQDKEKRFAKHPPLGKKAPLH